MASEFLKLKWGKLFYTHDVNKDNLVTIEDADLFSSGIAREFKLSKDEAQVAKDKVRRYWQEWLLGDEKKMDQATFIAKKEQDYLKNPYEFKENARRLFRNIIDVLDNNKDQMISEEEFEVMAKCTGFTNYNKKYMQAFPQIKPVYISLEEYLESFVEFNCNPDKSKIGREKPRLYGLGVVDDVALINQANK